MHVATVLAEGCELTVIYDSGAIICFLARYETLEAMTTQVQVQASRLRSCYVTQLRNSSRWTFVP